MKPVEKKKGHIDVDDAYSLLNRYPAEKVLALLGEVFQAADTKIDWNALVKKTATGITNPKEYQMLWRHIAYCSDLVDKVDDAAEPSDDDSDLEYDLEAYPAVTAEASAEVAAAVKVLIGSSGSSGGSKVSKNSTAKAPLTTIIPKGRSSNSLQKSLPASVQGTDITVPISVQKQPVPQVFVQRQSVLALAAGERSDANALRSTTLHPRRKRKQWTEEEDLELLAAVQKCGEGNWQNILKGDFKGERSATQLSQRWALIKKRERPKSNLSAGAECSGPQPSDKHLATNQALNMALANQLLTVGNGAVGTTCHPSRLKTWSEGNEAVNNALPQQSKEISKPGTSSSIALNSDSSVVKKLAVAAGTRIANSSEASLLKPAAQTSMTPKGEITLSKSCVITSTTSSTNPKPSTNWMPKRTIPSGSQPVVPKSRVTGSQPVRSTFIVLPSPSSLALTSSSTLPNKATANPIK